MKIKACCLGTPDAITLALSGTSFASEVLSKVVGEDLGVKNVLDRPAEYYLQMADIGPAPKEGVMGIEIRLTGASRDGRTPKQFHSALKSLVSISTSAVKQAMVDAEIRDRGCQVFCVIMLDGPVETSPNSGQYSCNLESSPEWVSAN